METKKVKLSISNIFETILATGTARKQILKYQAAVHAESEAEAMRKRWGHVMNQLKANHRAHEQRVDDFSSEGQIMYSAFIEVRPTLLDYIHVFVNWDNFEAGSLFFDRINREEGRLFPRYLTFKQRFAKLFGTAWKMQYYALAR